MTSPSSNRDGDGERRHPRPTAFSFTYPLQVRWNDFDALGHVNNAVYLTYFEAVRIAYMRHVFRESNDMPWMMAEVRCRYVSPILLDEPATAYLGVRKVGNSSLAFDMAIFAGEEERLAAEAEATQVHVGPDGRPRRIPDAWRVAIRDHEERARKPSQRSEQGEAASMPGAADRLA